MGKENHIFYVTPCSVECGYYQFALKISNDRGNAIIVKKKEVNNLKVNVL